MPRLASDGDPTPGLVLIYSRMHAHLPSAMPLQDRIATVGRESDNTLCIPEAAVSRYHARLERHGDRVEISDAGSTNGTLVNGRKVDRSELREHDVIRIGDTLFRYAASGIHAYGAYRVDGTVLTEHRLPGPSLLVGGCQIHGLLARITKVAPTSLAVVITGESGTGKELVARQVHAWSDRTGPFQAINCAALPPNLIESELFGYRRGAFTGATQDKAGLVRAAHAGTLFLDEIGDMPPEAQAKLLRVLQEKEVLPLGATMPEHVNVRVVCATHRDLDAYVTEGRFRGDLLARLRECAFELAPLRERREDLYPLVCHVLREAGRTEVRPSFTYMLALAHYDFPYNVRELVSAVKLSLALAARDQLELDHLPDSVQHALDGHGSAARRPPSSAMLAPSGAPDEAELRLLLSQHRGNIAAVGRALGKERMQIHRWLKRYAIDVAEYRE